MDKRFVIDAFPESAPRYRAGYAVVAIDVIRATTTAITAASTGRPVFPAPTLEAALQLASNLHNPILAGELDGDMPPCFDINNSPAELSGLSDVSRPLVLLSSSGTKLMCNAMGSDVVYLACFRNCTSLSQELVAQGHRQIALLGAGSRGNFREEDQLCCAWIGAELAQHGYAPQDRNTSEILGRWAKAQANDCLTSKSVEYLKRTGQLADLDFILNRINDLDEIFVLERGEVVMRIPASLAGITDTALSRSERLVSPCTDLT
jgi:2-phosphosulfolactate phosphatase